MKSGIVELEIVSVLLSANFNACISKQMSPEEKMETQMIRLYKTD